MLFAREFQIIPQIHCMIFVFLDQPSDDLDVDNKHNSIMLESHETSTLTFSHGEL